MCLLKPGEHNNNVPNCTHDECKNFKFLNRPACVYSMTQTGKSDQSSTMNGMPFQLPPSTKKQNLLDTLALQKMSAFKEVSNNRPSDDCFAEEESFALNKKKIKIDNNNYLKPQESAPMMLPMNVGYTQVIAAPNMTERQMVQPAFNTNMVDFNQQNLQMMPNTQTIFVPFNQNNQQQMEMNMPNISYVQQGVQPLQAFAQTLKMNQMPMEQPSGMMIPMTVPESTPKQDRSLAGLEEMMKETHKTLVEMLISQNKMLVNLKEKNDLVQDTLACLITEVNALKQTIKQTTNEKSATSSLPKQFVENSREAANTETLMHTLFGPNQEFPYQLMFKNEFQLPLYRERNFKFTVLLTDRNGNQIKNPNKIPLTLAIYSSENPPKYVDVNTSGNKILKGVIDKDLVNGSVTFEKIQIKEVTSHFRNGWIFFVVCPKTAAPGFIASSNAISAQMVKPLIVEKVVVKAKRAKLTNNAAGGNENEMNCDMDCEGEDNEEEQNKSTGDETQEIFTENSN